MRNLIKRILVQKLKDPKLHSELVSQSKKSLKFLETKALREQNQERNIREEQKLHREMIDHFVKDLSDDSWKKENGSLSLVTYKKNKYFIYQNQPNQNVENKPKIKNKNENVTQKKPKKKRSKRLNNNFILNFYIII